MVFLLSYTETILWIAKLKTSLIWRLSASYFKHMNKCMSRLITKMLNHSLKLRNPEQDLKIVWVNCCSCCSCIIITVRVTFFIQSTTWIVPLQHIHVCGLYLYIQNCCAVPSTWMLLTTSKWQKKKNNKVGFCSWWVLAVWGLGAMGFYVIGGHPLKLLAESRWNQLGVTNYAKYQIPKSVLYESEINKI